MTHSSDSHLKHELSKILELRNNCCKRLSSSESRSFELKFLDKISTPVFTGQKIKGEGCASVRVALYDCLTGAVVKSGREANANIELVVLKGDSDGDGGDNLTVEDFKRKIVKEIKGKKSLLKGKTMLKLKEGCCDIGEISFVHNSGWVKICQLSLAARVVDNFPGNTIQPAMTEYFMLKDRRTTLYEKKNPPALSDEIWRLNKIDKKGAFRKRLREGNIESVEDFLKLLVMEPKRLKEILRAGAKTWEAITEHASTCLIDESVQFCYYPNPEHKNGVVFNVVGNVQLNIQFMYLVPSDLTMRQFVYVIRKRIKLSAEKTIFIFVDNVLPPTGAILSAIYDDKKDEDTKNSTCHVQASVVSFVLLTTIQRELWNIFIPIR